MKHFLDFSNWGRKQLADFFKSVDSLKTSKDLFKGKTFILFFPESSIRTRVTFEKGILTQGGHVISFPSSALDKKEELTDVMGYLNNWADMVIVRHPEKRVIRELAAHSRVPVMNAMTNEDHPCEILADMYSLSKLYSDYLDKDYLFVGANENIGNTWGTAANCFGLHLSQAAPPGFEINGAQVFHNAATAFQQQDIILTDPISAKNKEAFAAFQVTKDLMMQANNQALLNPCPPFYRGEEVTAEVIEEYFVGYEFKQSLMAVQVGLMQACFEGE